jgi:hypothetical protein
VSTDRSVEVVREVDDLRQLALSFRRCRGVVSSCCSGPRQPRQRRVAAVERVGVFSCLTACTRGPLFRAGAPLTDVAYLCHNCGSVHEVESIRENLILNLRTAASYQLSKRRMMLDPRPRFLRLRMTWGLAQALWPRYAQHPRRAQGRRPVPRRAAPVSDRPVHCHVAIGGGDAGLVNSASAGASGRLATISVATNPASRQDHDQAG